MDNFEEQGTVSLRKSKIIEMTSAMLSSISPKATIYNIVKKAYGETFLKNIKDKYDYMLRILNSLNMGGYEILEFLLINNEFDHILKYESHIKGLDDIVFLHYFFGGYIPKESFQKVIQDPQTLEEFHKEFNYCCSSLEALKYIIFEKDIFLSLLFNCIKEFDNKSLSDTMEQMDYLYEDLYRTISYYLKENNPLETSQILMGKTFKNRGPYENFVFIPTFFLPGKVVRFFGKDQILLYKVLENPEEGENKLKIQQCLKVLSDPTRFEIIELLQQNEPMFGKQIAEYMNLSTPTISHHLDLLKDIGFINEEREKNLKYFSSNKDNINQFINLLHKTLNK